MMEIDEQLSQKREFLARLSEVFQEFMASIEQPDGMESPQLMILGCDLNVCDLSDGLESSDIERLLTCIDEEIGARALME